MIGCVSFWRIREALIALALSALLVASFEDPAEAYVPFPSPTGAPYVWPLAELPSQSIPWEIAPGAPPILRESVLAATAQWSKASGERVKFVEGPGGITVHWDATGDLIMDRVYLAYTTFNAGVDFKTTSAVIVINALNYSWQSEGDGGVGSMKNGKREANLDSVVLHELGHALGLDHADKNVAAIVGGFSAADLPTMNAVIYPGSETLHLDDESGILALYGDPAAPTPPTPLRVEGSPLKGTAPLSAKFTLQGGDPSARWDFGNGSDAIGETATHRFTAPGTYTVTVHSNGKVGMATVEVEKKLKKKKKVKTSRGYSSSR